MEGLFYSLFSVHIYSNIPVTNLIQTLEWKWFQATPNKRNLELNVKCQLKQHRNWWQLSIESLVPHFCSFFLINTPAMGSYSPFLLLINLDFQIMSDLGAFWLDFVCAVHNSPSDNLASWSTAVVISLCSILSFKFSSIAFYQHVFWHLLQTMGNCQILGWLEFE